MTSTWSGPEPQDTYPNQSGFAGPAEHPAHRQAPAKRRSLGPVLALALVSGLVGGAGGAGITYGLMDEGSQVAERTEAGSNGSAEGTENTAAPASAPSGVDWAKITEQVQPSVVAIEAASATEGHAGSGVIIDKAGYVLTNHHVIAGTEDIHVTLSTGQIVSATLVGSDPSTDLAVLKLADTKGISPATFGSSASLVVGQPVVAVGNPLGLSQTVTTGIISALDRPVVTKRKAGDPDPVITNAIQIDAAINPGNSGGPLFDAQGKVIGINSSIASISEGDVAGSIGLGFAIPIDLAKRIATDIIDTGTVSHAFVGVSTRSEVVTVDGESRVAAVIGEVVPGSPADKAGLREGDAITAIDDDEVVSNTSLTGYVRQHAPGETVTLSIVRDGSATTVDLTLESREAI
ncbi:MAG: trypsin-like peptidase domain-containing protein [Flaviflexus sp.]|nr:trypsin-like peptidase domain-containing protein [Flaviflexus sp.]